MFWNAGIAALKGEDVRTEYPVGWAFPSSTSVLGVRVLHTTREANHFEAYKSPTEANVVLCRFEYLNRGDGALIEVLHTGDKRDPKPVGEILNVSPALIHFGPISSEAASGTSQLRTYLYEFTLKTRRGALRPFPPLIRTLRSLRVAFWRLILLVTSVALLVFAANTEAVYNFTCDPLPAGTTVEQCRATATASQWIIGAIGAVVLLFLLANLLRRSRRYPSVLDPRDFL